MVSWSCQGNVDCLLCISIAMMKSDSRGVATVNICSSISQPNSLCSYGAHRLSYCTSRESSIKIREVEDH